MPAGFNELAILIGTSYHGAGGAEAIKHTVATAVRIENASRVLLVDNLPAELYASDVKHEILVRSAKVVPVFEDVVVSEGRAIVKMGSVGTALGARMSVNAGWPGCRVAWGVDECEGDLNELAIKWAGIRGENAIVYHEAKKRVRVVR